MRFNKEKLQKILDAKAGEIAAKNGDWTLTDLRTLVVEDKFLDKHEFVFSHGGLSYRNFGRDYFQMCSFCTEQESEHIIPGVKVLKEVLNNYKVLKKGEQK